MTWSDVTRTSKKNKDNMFPKAFFKPNCNVPPKAHKTCSNKQLQFYRRSLKKTKKLTKIYLKLRLHGGKKYLAIQWQLSP